MQSSSSSFPWPQRPRMPQHRPHTVHAASNYPEPVQEEDSDDQSTPRASLVRPMVHNFTAFHSPSPAETSAAATDLTSIFADSSHAPSFSSQPSSAAQPLSSSASTTIDAQRPSRRLNFQRTFSVSAAPPSATHNIDAGSHQTKTASLGRRFSRRYQDKLVDLKENIHRHAMPSRIRRSSTPQNIDAQVVERYGNHPIVPPLSPSKRNAKQSESRPKKLRSAFGLALSDRKDTPAPIASAQSLQRPLTATKAFWNPSGGEQARQSVAAFKTGLELEDAHYDVVKDLRARRHRLGSLSSAADSGADLSTYGGSSLDANGDVDMTDDSPCDSSTNVPNLFNKLPREICLQIFENLNAETLLRSERTCKAFQAFASETSVWRSAFFEKYQRIIHTDPPPVQVGGAGLGRPNRPQQEWKRMYKARTELEANWRKGPTDAGKAIYLSGHTDSVYCLQFDEEKIITGSRDRTIRVWDINTFQCIKVIGGPSVRPVQGPKVLRTVDYPAFHLATASVNGTAYGESIYHVPAEWHDASILCLQYDDEILVTGSSDSDLLIWDIHTYEPIKRLRKHTGGVLDVALDSKHIVSCSKDSRIIVWDRETFEPKGDLTGHRGPVNAVQLRGKWLVSASGDGIARLWDLDEMKLAKEFSAKERGLAAVEFSEDTRYVLAGGNDHITYKFDTQTGKEVKQFTGHSQLVRSLWLDSANKRVVSGSYDLDLRVYDFETGEEIWRAEEWTTSWMLAAKSDYRRIVATSQDGRILVVDFGLQKGGREDGDKIPYLDLLRGMDRTTAITFRNPWTMAPI